ncbi:hypothetical protein [Chamaesiphon sp. GL140_3_metabinner_50]|uniref:hypothetical protein n=1 Tax=Chamaesiphon sp. GL140_3_metabinner_50 TaxID=2970812 RepID=UPI0025DF526A|nr:hypothetical protein [Chamaesiphon sp. GL140_3_metabinner_50]
MAIDRQDPVLKKLPLTSLLLLFVTYTTFGWLLYDWTENRQVWLLAALGITILGSVVTYPSKSVSIGFDGFFKTDTRALILIILVSVLAVVLLTWSHFLVDAIVMFAAGLLVSLDLKIRRWSKPLTLCVIVGWQLLGMSAGLGLHYLYIHPVQNLPAYFYSDYWFKFIEGIYQNFSSQLKL